MDRYSVFIKNESSAVTTRQTIEEAFDSRSHIHVAGQRESVPVEFELDVSMYKRLREGGVILMFSGVTLPDERPFLGEFEENQTEPIEITLNIDPDLDQ